MKRIFISGIDTDIGKTIVAAVVVKALCADYWKPVQSGASIDSDKETVRSLVGDHSGAFHDEAVVLAEPLSPHEAAALEERTISREDILRPHTSNILVVEGAGGLLVPLNNNHTIADLIEEGDFVLLVTRHYLGSINHTLLSVDHLNKRGIEPALIVNGSANESSEDAITTHGSCNILGHLNTMEEVTPESIRKAAEKWRPILEQWIGTNAT